MTRNSSRAFSLVEVVVAIGVLGAGVVAAIALSLCTGCGTAIAIHPDGTWTAAGNVPEQLRGEVSVERGEEDGK